MKDLLAPAHQRLVRRACAGRVLVAFDYDGTLAPIVSRREQARMRRTTLALLRRTTALYPCAVVSGRARSSLLPLLEGADLKWVIGNHGAEWPGGRRRPPQALERTIATWKRRLTPVLRSLSGVQLEDKAWSLSLHYRAAPDPAKARLAILDAAAGLRGGRIVEGLAVVNLLLASAAHKGVALRRLLTVSRCSRAIYVGDDVTDEDVFRLETPNVLSIRVGRSPASAAPWFIASQLQMDRLLRALIRARFERSP